MKKKLGLVTLILMLSSASAKTSGSMTTSPDSLAIFVAILSPFIASAIIAVFYNQLKDFSAYLGIISAFLSLIATTTLFGTQGTITYQWIPSLNIALEFYIDGLSLLIATLASSIGMLVFLYSRAYMDHGVWKRKYYATLTAFMGSMIGLVFSSNLMLLFLFWEFTSICSFLLISHNQRTKSGIYASKKALLITVGSGIALLSGFLILGESAGTYSIAEMLHSTTVAQSLSRDAQLAVIGLIGLGAAAKSAQVPLHIWLPNAMEAPTPVSAFLHSATMVKAGVFLIGRFRPILMTSEAWNILFITLGLVTMTIAAILAVGAKELKELLAYSTASHLGLIVAGFGFTTVLGAETSTFHILNHAVFKAALFMVAGIVLHEAGTQKISKLSGLRHEWPGLTAIATICALSMAGIPPLNGFYSKELLFETAYHTASHSGGITWILPGLAVLGSVFTFIYSVRFVSVFYGESSVKGHKIPKLMIVPPSILAFLALAIGFFPNEFIHNLVNPALFSVSDSTHGLSVHLPAHITPALTMSILTISGGFVGFKKVDEIHNLVNNTLEHRLLAANYYYDGLLHLTDQLSDFIVDKLECGLLRTYVIWVLSVAGTLATSGYLISGSISLPEISASKAIIIVLGTSIASVYAIIRSRTYISSVLTLSILGFMVSIYYLLMDAPDLVMTQLVVETLSLIIFLLVLDQLPKFSKKVNPTRKIKDIVISGLIGLAVFLSVAYSTMAKTPKELAEYYAHHALPGSGGTNIVNVILVDFRGVDTMGEISVIAMAGLAVLMLFKMRGDQ